VTAVTDNDEFLVDHRPKGKSIVMISLAEYNALQETLNLNISKANRQRLEIMAILNFQCLTKKRYMKNSCNAYTFIKVLP